MTDPVVLFDGNCTLCNGAVQFLIDHERSPALRFAPLQSEAGQAVLEKAVGKEEALRLVAGATGSGDPDSMVFVRDGRLHAHSTAVLHLAAGYMTAPWRWAVVFFLVPRFLRDAVYRFIARNRYRWFGKEETCRVPTPDLRKRFLA